MDFRVALAFASVGALALYTVWQRGVLASSSKRASMSKFKHIVAHRGLHDGKLSQLNYILGKSQLVRKEDLTAPVENTLRAYQEAWQLGFNLAECDITSTVDNQVFLCHDETFERVAAQMENMTQEEQVLARKQATTLTRGELQRIRLRDDSRPTTLLDCLLLAHKLSSASAKKQMVVEFKQDGLFPPDADTIVTPEEEAQNLASAERMVRIVTLDVFGKRPDLLEHVALMFSFGADVMRFLSAWRLASKSKVLLLQLTEAARRRPQHKTLRLELEDEESIAQAVHHCRQNKLDGLYLEFEDGMLARNSVAQRNLAALAREVIVGVWFYEDQVDGFGLAEDGIPCYETLLALGVRFVNADVKPENANEQFSSL